MAYFGPLWVFVLVLFLIGLLSNMTLTVDPNNMIFDTQPIGFALFYTPILLLTLIVFVYSITFVTYTSQKTKAIQENDDENNQEEIKDITIENAFLGFFGILGSLICFFILVTILADKYKLFYDRYIEFY